MIQGLRWRIVEKARIEPKKMGENSLERVAHHLWRCMRECLVFDGGFFELSDPSRQDFYGCATHVLIRAWCVFDVPFLFSFLLINSHVFSPVFCVLHALLMCAMMMISIFNKYQSIINILPSQFCESRLILEKLHLRLKINDILFKLLVQLVQILNELITIKGISGRVTMSKVIPRSFGGIKSIKMKID